MRVRGPRPRRTPARRTPAEGMQGRRMSAATSAPRLTRGRPGPARYACESWIERGRPCPSPRSTSGGRARSIGCSATRRGLPPCPSWPCRIVSAGSRPARSAGCPGVIECRRRIRGRRSSRSRCRDCRPRTTPTTRCRRGAPWRTWAAPPNVPTATSPSSMSGTGARTTRPSPTRGCGTCSTARLCSPPRSSAPPSAGAGPRARCPAGTGRCKSTASPAAGSCPT
jgi:hypothetical protein